MDQDGSELNCIDLAFPFRNRVFQDRVKEVWLLEILGMSIIVWSVLLIAFMWALTSRSTMVRYLARGLAVVIALAAAAAAIGLISIGQKAHWTSDGPGMLLIMLGIPICGIIAWFFAILAFTTTASSEDTPSESQSGVRLLTQVSEIYKELTKRPQ
jgi:hypothetical protein